MSRNVVLLSVLDCFSNTSMIIASLFVHCATVQGMPSSGPAASAPAKTKRPWKRQAGC